MIEGSPAVEGMGKPSAVPVWVRLQDAVQEALFQVVRRLVPSRREADPFLWNIRLIHRVLWVTLVGLGLYTVVDLVFIRPRPRVTRAAAVLSVQRPPEPGAEPALAETLKPMSSYVEALSRRNPFTGGGAQQTAESQRAAIDQLVQGLTVVGIDRGPSPVALIEDSAQQKTYVVRVGDELNGMAVKQINSEGVLLKYEGEEYLLQ